MAEARELLDRFYVCTNKMDGLYYLAARKLGVNDSILHEDFMIGTPDLSITAKCRDGMEREVFRDGTWAF